MKQYIWREGTIKEKGVREVEKGHGEK